MTKSSPPTSFPKGEIKVLLLENVHASAHEIFRGRGLPRRGRPARAQGGRARREARRGRPRPRHPQQDAASRARALEAGKRLLSVGAFCIGTNQIDLEAAKQRGVPVFNAPFSNTRSVAELVIGEIVMLARQLGDRSREVHEGEWRKVATSSFEVRGKTLGIVGYGHIGSQVGVLAEAIGMRVIFYDIRTKLPMGNNQAVDSLDDAPRASDFVTLHVPETPQTKGMIGASRARADEDGRVPPQPEPRHRRRSRRARRGDQGEASSAAPRSTSIPRSPRATATTSRASCAGCRT